MCRFSATDAGSWDSEGDLVYDYEGGDEDEARIYSTFSNPGTPLASTKEEPDTGAWPAGLVVPDPAAAAEVEGEANDSQSSQPQNVIENELSDANVGRIAAYATTKAVNEADSGSEAFDNDAAETEMKDTEGALQDVQHRPFFENESTGPGNAVASMSDVLKSTPDVGDASMQFCLKSLPLLELNGKYEERAQELQKSIEELEQSIEKAFSPPPRSASSTSPRHASDQTDLEYELQASSRRLQSTAVLVEMLTQDNQALRKSEV